MSRIERRPLHDIVAERLRDMIVEGELVAGVVLPEMELCTSLGVSRTPIREALKLLVLDGLVEHLPQRGFAVRILAIDEARQMLELLAELEGFACALACTSASQEGIREIRQIHEAMLIAFRAGDMSRYFKLNQEIHDGIVALSGNLALADTHRRLSLKLRRVRFLSNRTESDWQSSVRDHEAIIKHLEARDAAALRPVMTRHVLDIWKVVEPVLAQRDMQHGLREAG
jgi:DNA-binding GntR family transcriptional regulator